MQLKDAQTRLRTADRHPAQTTRESLGRLRRAVEACVQAYESGREPLAQTLLEDALGQWLLAAGALSLDADRCLERLMARQTTQSIPQAFHLYPDRVVLRVGDEDRGGWPLYTEEDRRGVLRLASDLGIAVEERAGEQLDLFVRPAPTPET